MMARPALHLGAMAFVGVGVVLGLFLGLIVFALVACSGGRSERASGDAAPTVEGRFEIRDSTRRIGSGAFPNQSANPFGRQTVSERVVSFAGERVSVAVGDARFSRFHEAWVLEVAPVPAVLVALQGFHLLVDRGGVLEVVPLSAGSDDVASWQWLDAVDGQPGPEHDVTVRDRRGESRSLAGGRLLLLNHDVVLDVATLGVHPVRSPLHSPAVWDFAVSRHPAKSLSPGRTQYVLAGTFDHDGISEAALVAVPIATDAAYAVRYDAKATRIESPWQIHPGWVAHYFSWSRDAKGEERLEAKPDPARLPFLGRLEDSGTGDLTYRLDPVLPAMADTLRAFLERELGARIAATPGSDRRWSVDVGGVVVALVHDPETRTLRLEADDPEPAQNDLIRRVAARFDEALARGLHAASFVRDAT